MTLNTRIEAQRSGFDSEKEEGANIVQFSPQGGNGTVFAPSDVVRVTGVEPARLATREPKSRMSANSIIPAYNALMIAYGGG